MASTHVRTLLRGLNAENENQGPQARKIGDAGAGPQKPGALGGLQQRATRTRAAMLDIGNKQAGGLAVREQGKGKFCFTLYLSYENIA